MKLKNTVDDVIRFILANRKNKVFKGMDTEAIIHAVYQALSVQCFSYSLNEVTGEVNGVVIGSVIPEQNVFFVTECLTTEPKVLKNLILKFCSMFPNYKLEARRRGKIKRYNTQKLISKITNLT